MTAPSTLATKDPFFVLGWPRSGTSLLRLMLTCHPDLVVPPESSFITWLHGDFGDWRDTDADGDRLDVFLRALGDARKFNTWRLSTDLVRTRVLEVRPRDYAHLCMCVYHSYAELQGKSHARLGDKNNVYIRQVEALGSLYQQCIFVLIVRDPRDVFASHKELSKGPQDGQLSPNLFTEAPSFAREWSQIQRSLITHLEALGTSRFVHLRYEDLVSEPKLTLSPVLSQLGVSWSEGITDFWYLNQLHQLEPIETLGWKMKTLGPVSRSQVGRWQRDLEPAEISKIEEECRDLLDLYEYD